MESFLNTVARKLLERHEDFNKVGIIMPSRRAAVFLKKELSQLIAKPIFAPYISTTEDFLLETLGWEQENNPTLVFKLYTSYLALDLEDKESFVDFSRIAQTLLADFNEVDRYLINANELFSYISDSKRIESWNLTPGESVQTDMVSSYLKFWESLSDLYHLYRDQLKEDKRVYQGLAYREMAEQTDYYLPLIKEQYEALYFVGFSALNLAEERILSRLYNEGLAHFFWDIDSYYFHDKLHEGGKFLRESKLLRKLIEKGDFNGFGDYLGKEPKCITIKSVAGNTMQAITANSSVLEYQANNLEDVAVVMADENLLTPFLNNLAEDIEALNVTMGLPMRYSPIAGFYQLLWEMHIWFEATSRKDSNGNPGFHFQRWDDLLGNPSFKRLEKETGSFERIRAEIRRQNQVFISYQELQEWMPFSTQISVDFLFEDYSLRPSELCRNLVSFTESVKELYQGSITQTGILFSFFRLFERLAKLFETYNYAVDLKTANRFYKELLQTETVDLQGEPLSGLQVMGMLETRTLDFRNVIFTSVNEDVLPKGRSQNSLIPFDIKHQFGLPTYLDKDGVFAYHFFRLLQRAENIVIIHNNENKGLGGGEPSRFITQLEYELARVNSRVRFRRTSVSGKVSIGDEKEKEVKKTDAVMKRLYELAEKGISPSALIDYINNPLEFYYKRVLGLQELDEVEEVIGYNTQGTVVHEILQNYYSKDEESAKGALEYLSGDLPVFDKKEAHLRTDVVQSLKKHGLKAVDQGKNLLIREILVGMLRNFLSKERSELKRLGKLSLLALEDPLSTSLVLPGGIKVNLKGVADRIDKLEDQLRVIDYKTGAVHPADLKFNSWDELRQPEKKNKSFQLMMYAYLYVKTHPDTEKVYPSVISLRNVKEWPIPLYFQRKQGVGKDEVDEFEQQLMLILSQIFNPEIPFTEKILSLSNHV